MAVTANSTPAPSRRALLAVAAVPVMLGSYPGIRLTVGADGASSDLAAACIEQADRLTRWDANPGSLSEEEGSAELDRSSAVFRRAIEEPSAGLRDLAGKAALMLDDLDRFHPEAEYGSDDYRLMRVILREAIAMGGQA